MNLLLPILAMVAATPAAPPFSSDPIDPPSLRRWYEHGRCLVQRQGSLAEKMLATRPTSGDSLEAFVEADKMAGCFTRDPPTPTPILHSNATRGAIAEALLLRDFSAVGVRRGAHVAAIASMSVPPKHAGGAASAAHAEAMLALAECVVRADPAGSYAVFSTEVAGPAENAAVRALVPAIAQCVPPDFQFTLKAPVLRSYLAEAAYRVSVTQPPQAALPGK